jgi:hypothetical protein
LALGDAGAKLGRHSLGDAIGQLLNVPNAVEIGGFRHR